MNYFIENKEREGTCYYEFYKGKWDQQSFWSENSLYLSDDLADVQRNFFKAVKEAIPTYDRYGVTEVGKEQWQVIGKIIAKEYPACQPMYDELTLWVGDVFETEEVFTILGI